MLVLSRWVKKVFGEVQWAKPAWCMKLAGVGLRKLLFLLLVLGMMIMAGIWYYHLPETKFISAKFSELQTPSLSDEPQDPASLTVQFGFINEGELTTQSVIPITSRVNQSLTSNDITISPQVEGIWQWLDDYSLSFKPKTPWIAGQNYRVTFAPKVFAPQAKMQRYDFAFTAPKLQADITEFELYQNPKDPSSQQLVATLQFNYPVDHASLEKNLVLRTQSGQSTFPITFTYSKQDRVAYVKSGQIALAKTAQYYVLDLHRGCHAQGSKVDLANPVSNKVLVPDAGSVLKITSVSDDIVRNLQGTPEQILKIQTSIGVSTQEIQKAVHVYELPRDKPAGKSTNLVNNYAWTQPLEVTSDILALAKPITLTALPAMTDYASLQNFKLQAEPGHYLFVRIDHGMSGMGAYKLKDDYLATVPVPDYPKEIRFLHQGALLAKGHEHKLSLSVRGLSSVHFEIGRVLPHEINHLITQTSGQFEDPYFSNESFSKNDVSEIFSTIEDYNASDPAKAQFGVLDLDQYLKPSAENKYPLGLFLIKAEGWDRVNKRAVDNSSITRLVLITDQDLIVKTNQDGSREVFVSSITSGLPIANASIAVLGKNGLPLMTARSDQQGHVKFPAFSDESYRDDKQPAVIVATQGNDVSFISYEKRDREVNFSRFDTGGITDDQGLNDLTAFVFSDRGLYKPGETAHIGLIVKKAYGLDAANSLPIEVVITDPSGNVMESDKMTLSADGFASLDFVSQQTAMTGTYNVAVYVTKDKERGAFLGETNLLLQDFLPDTLKISAKLNQTSDKGWLSPEKLAVQMDLKNLFGTPSGAAKVNGKIILEPHHFSFPEFSGYHFFDPFEQKNKTATTTTIDLPEKLTDAHGKASFDLDLSRFANATFEMRVYITGFEKTGGRSVNTQLQALISPLKDLVGYKPDGDFSFIKQKTERHVSFIAIDPTLQKVAVNKLQMTLLQQTQVVTLVKKDNGTYAYQSVTQEKPLQKNELNIPATGLDQPLNTEQIGNFVLVIAKVDGTVLARIPYAVVGDDATAVQKNTELHVVLNKKQYQANDEIELQISAPYTGSGLITLERDHVYAYRWFKSIATRSVQKLKIPADFIGNGYVNVTYIRDWESPDIFLSPLSYSVVPISVDKAKHQLVIDLQAPKKVKSGDNVTVTYHTNNPGHVVIFAIDEGILQAGDYKMPDPLGFFFQKRALNVSTTQIVDQILPKFISEREQSAVGGDTDRKKMEAYLNPFKRKNRPPIVFWSGLLNADQANKTISFPVPSSFNGTLRIMAVATGNNAVGSTEIKTLAQNDVILNPSTPTFVAPNDDFDVAVNVTNMTGDPAKQDLHIRLTPSANLKVDDAEEKTVQLADKQDTTVHFKLHALEHLGQASLTFSASNAKHIVLSHLEETLSLRPAVPLMMHLTGGFQAQGIKDLNIDTNRYPELSVTSISAGANPLIFVRGIKGYLDAYPYDCTEQLVSRAFVHLMMHELPSNSHTTDNQLNDLINKISQRQSSDGSFMYWPGMQNQSSMQDQQQFVSVYAMHLLTEARDAKEVVPANVIRNGLNYLRELAGKDADDLTMARNQAYAIYILTRNEVVTTNYLTNLQLYLEQNQAKTWKQDIVSSYIAATYALLHDQKTADQLIKGYKLNRKLESDTPFYASEVTDAQYIYLLAQHFPEQLKKLGQDTALTLTNYLSQSGISTTSAAFNVLALNNYQHILPSGDTPVQITQISADSKHTTVVENAGNSLVLTPAITKLELARDKNLGFFYLLSEKGFAKNLANLAVANGLEVVHNYTEDKAESQDSFKIGTEITVHIILRNLTANTLSNIAVADLLPGGFEIVNSSANGPYYYQNLREDRALFFMDLPVNQRVEITYKIKAINPGHYQTPPAFAEDMYNPMIRAMGSSGKIAIHE